MANAPPLTRITEALKRAHAYMLSTYQGGWWPYFASGDSATEATAWCGIAIREMDSSVRQSVIDFLISTQNKDGGWSTAPHVGTSDWCSGPAILALRLLNLGSDQAKAEMFHRSIQSGLNYLFDSRCDPNPPVLRLLILSIKGMAGLNYGRGWPWTPHCWNWVEPSAYNLLALKIPHLAPPEEFQLVVKHAHSYFLEHACEGGGWNHGANRCLGRSAPAFLVTTAEALLALQDLADTPQVQSGLSYLAKMAHQHRSAMSAAWAILARNAYGQNTDEETSALLAAQKADGCFGPNLMVTGLAAVALTAAAGQNPFIISKRAS